MMKRVTRIAVLTLAIAAPLILLGNRTSWAATASAPEQVQAQHIAPQSPNPTPAQVDLSTQSNGQPPILSPITTSSSTADPLLPAYGPEHKVVMARVGNETITVSDFMKYLTQDTRLVVKAKTAEGRAEVLRSLLINRLLEEGMRQEGFLPRDQAVDNKGYMEAFQKLAAKYFPRPEVPSEEALYKYYEEHPDFYGIPAMVRIGQIQFQVPENADENTKAAVKAKADDAVKRLRAGESFSKLAEELSDNPQGKVAKGDLGFFQPEKDEWLRKAVADLKVGQFSEALESPVGYEVLLLQDKRDAMLAPYRNVRDNVIARMQEEVQVKAREDYAWKVAKKIGVSIEKPELKGAIPASVAAEINPPPPQDGRPAEKGDKSSTETKPNS